MALGSMNRTMNLPSLQRIAMEFERENDIMEQRQEMMDDAIDDAMDVGIEEEGDEVVERVLEEIGVDLSQAVSWHCTLTTVTSLICHSSWARRHLDCSLILFRKARLLKQLAVVEGSRAMTTSKHGLTVLGGKTEFSIHRRSRTPNRLSKKKKKKKTPAVS